jgi:hypothetical protein
MAITPIENKDPLRNHFMKAGITAAREGLTYTEAAERDGEALYEYAVEALGRPITQWDNTTLCVAYELGFKSVLMPPTRA